MKSQPEEKACGWRSKGGEARGQRSSEASEGATTRLSSGCGLKKQRVVAARGDKDNTKSKQIELDLAMYNDGEPVDELKPGRW